MAQSLLHLSFIFDLHIRQLFSSLYPSKYYEFGSSFHQRVSFPTSISRSLPFYLSEYCILNELSYTVLVGVSVSPVLRFTQQQERNSMSKISSYLFEHFPWLVTLLVGSSQ